MKHVLLLAAGLMWSAGATFGAALASGDFVAELNPDFPGLKAYSYAGQQMRLPASSRPVVLLNGTEYTPKVSLAQSGPSSAEYQLAIQEIAVTMKVRFAIARQVLTVTISEIHETGGFVVRYVEIPGLVLIAGGATDEVALGNFPPGSYASEKPEDHDLFSTVAGSRIQGQREEQGQEPRRCRQPRRLLCLCQQRQNRRRHLFQCDGGKPPRHCANDGRGGRRIAHRLAGQMDLARNPGRDRGRTAGQTDRRSRRERRRQGDLAGRRDRLSPEHAASLTAAERPRTTRSPTSR